MGVDFLRSGYVSLKHLFSNSDVLTAGIYWRLGSDAVMLPMPHIFGSLNWWRNDLQAPGPDLGEDLQSRRKYYVGTPPPQRPAATFCGDRELFRTGDVYPSPIVPLVGGVHPCCRPGAHCLPETMDDFGTQTGWIHYGLAVILTATYEPTEDVALALCTSWLPTMRTFNFVANSDNSLIPGSAIAVCDQVCLVWISGTTSPAQLMQQGIFALTGPRDVGQFGTNSLYQDAASAIADRIRVATANRDVPVVLCGHSYGGAVAVVLSGLRLFGRPGSPTKTFTWGCPKPGDLGLRNLVNAALRIQFVNRYDPVPAIPPDPNINWWMRALLPEALTLQLPRWVHVGECIQINQDGTTEVFDQAAMPFDLLTRVIFVGLSLAIAGDFIEHRMWRYAAAVRNVLRVAGMLPDCPMPELQLQIFDRNLAQMAVGGGALGGGKSGDVAGVVYVAAGGALGGGVAGDVAGVVYVAAGGALGGGVAD